MRSLDASRSPVGFAAPAFAECAFVAIPSRGRSDHAVHLLSTYSVETTCGFALSLATHVGNKAFHMSVRRHSAANKRCIASGLSVISNR